MKKEEKLVMITGKEFDYLLETQRNYRELLRWHIEHMAEVVMINNRKTRGERFKLFIINLKWRLVNLTSLRRL